MSPSLRIDPQRAGSGVRDLFTPEGEYSVAIAGCRKSSESGEPQDFIGAVPDVVFLELYAYECVERCRALAGQGGTWRIPFWPGCLFDAADIRVHAGRELAMMLPPFASVVVVARAVPVLVHEAVRVLGAIRFDPERYREAVVDHALAAGWEVRR